MTPTEEGVAPQADGQDTKKKADQWRSKIKSAEQYYSEWTEECKIAIAIFGLEKATTKKAKVSYGIAWANRQIMHNATYARPPKCVAAPRFQDSGDRDLQRLVSDVLERSLNTNADLTGAHNSFLKASQDYVDFGRGAVWVRYEPVWEKQLQEQPPVETIDETGALIATPQEPVEVEVLTDERVCIDYVARNDFLCEPATCWEDVTWVARRVHVTEDGLKKRFGEKAGEYLEKREQQKRAREVDRGSQPYGKTDRISYWEIWDKNEGTCLFFSECGDEGFVLEQAPPHLKFRNFFPCPRPAFGTLIFDEDIPTLIPRPDVLMYRDQLRSVNRLQQKILALTGALKVRGFMGGSGSREGAAAVQRSLRDERDEAVITPVPGAASIMDQKNMGITYMPIEVIASVLQQARQMLREAVQDIYEITGIADIVRGQTNANETLGAQQLKSQFANSRIRPKQEEMQRLCRDAYALAAEVICENFDPMRVIQMSGVTLDNPMYPPELIIGTLRDEIMRGYILDIETDSTIAADEQADKESRVEFLTAFSTAMQQLVQLVTAAPMLAPLGGEVLKYLVRTFRVGRNLEDEVDAAVRTATAMLAPPPMPMQGVPPQGMPQEMPPQGEMVPQQQEAMNAPF